MLLVGVPRRLARTSQRHGPDGQASIQSAAFDAPIQVAPIADPQGMPRRPRRPGTVHCVRPVSCVAGTQGQPATDEPRERNPPGVSAAATLRTALRPGAQLPALEDDGVQQPAGSDKDWSDDVASNEAARNRAGIGPTAALNRQQPVWAAGSGHLSEEEIYRLAQRYGVATVPPSGMMVTRVTHEQRPVLETTLPGSSRLAAPRQKRQRKHLTKKTEVLAHGTRSRCFPSGAAVPAATGRGPDLNHRISDTLEKAAAMTQDMKSLQWAIFVQLDSPGGSTGKTARRRPAETPSDRLSDGILLPASHWSTLVESDARTYSAAVKDMVHKTQDAAKKLRIDGLDKDLVRRTLNSDLGENPSLCDLQFVSMACNNAGCLMVRKGSVRESLHHFHISLEYFQQQREQRRGGTSRTALVKHLENGARRRLTGDGPADEENRRRDEAIIRLNLCGALQALRMYKAAFTQAQTSLTLLLHDHADNAASGSLLALAHFYVGHLKREVLSADDWLAMQNRATCAQVLESLIQSVEVSRRWSKSNATTRCFEAHAKHVLARLDSCAMDEELQPGYSDVVTTEVKDSVVLGTGATLASASASASAAFSLIRDTDIEKGVVVDMSPELQMMHLRTPSPSKWTREWKNIAGLNKRDEIALFNDTLETRGNPTPQTTESNCTAASLIYGANSTSSVFDELPDLAPRMLSEVSSANIRNGKQKSVDAHREYYQGRSAVHLSGASLNGQQQAVHSKARTARQNENSVDSVAKHPGGSSSGSSVHSNDTIEQDLSTGCTPESTLSTTVTDFMLTATPNYLRHGATDLGQVSPSFRNVLPGRTPTGTPASILQNGTGLHEHISTPSVLRDTLQTPSILRSGGAAIYAGLFDSMRSVDFDLGLNETVTREKLSVQWPSSRGRADAVTIPHTRSDESGDDM